MILRRLRLIMAALLLFWTTGCANGLFYHPDHVEYMKPSDSGLAYEDVTFQSKDGTLLHGWFIPAKGGA